MNKPYSIFKLIFCLLLCLNGFNIIVAQTEQLESHIQEKLCDIDELIVNKEYNLALSKLTDLESYTEFISSDENRLSLNLKKAEAHYGIKDKEIAMGLLFNGLDELNNLDLKELEIDYSDYLGKIFYDSKDYKRSLNYYRQSLKIAHRIKDTLNELNSYFFIGKNYSQREENDSAINYYNKIINYPITHKTANIIARSYTNLSGKYITIGDLELSLKYANRAIEIRKEEQDTLGIATALINLSGIYYEEEEYEKVIENCERGYELIKNFNSNEAFRTKEGLIYNLAYSNEMLGNYKNAYHFLEEAATLTDSLARASVDKNISELAARYNIAKQAQKFEEEKSKRQRTQFFFYAAIFAFISVLVLSYIFYRNYRLKREMEVDKLINDTQIKIINATIDAKEKERKSIAEILHDSVSALLSSANLHLQATKAQLKTGYPQEITKAQTIVNEASVKIRDLSHDLISSVLLKFGLAFAVHDMCQKYSNSEIAFFSDDDGVKRYEQDFEIKIHSIIEELVNNILKHSKAKNASIMLAHRENNMLSIRMNDDGVGFDAKKAKMKGGLGLSHIEARITVMKGVFNIVSSKDNGTSIFILVPIIPKA